MKIRTWNDFQKVAAGHDDNDREMVWECLKDAGLRFDHRNKQVAAAWKFYKIARRYQRAA
jgi:hypothetical protein